MALGKLFDLVGGKIVPKEDCYIIEPLKVIMDEYPDKATHNKIYAYLHYMKSMKPADNPYADVVEDEKEEQILRNLKLDIDTEDIIIKQALECVEEKYSTPFYVVYKGLKAAFENCGKELAILKINFNAKEGNVSNIMRFAKDYKELRDSFKMAYKDFDEEQGTIRNRGGAASAYDEDDD